MNTNIASHPASLARGVCRILLNVTVTTMLWCMRTPATAQIYLTNTGNGSPGNGTVGEYTVSGSLVNAALVTGLNQPRGIVVYGANLFVVNGGSGTIGKYDADTGAVVNASLITGLNNPTGIVLSDDGVNLFVANNGGGTIGKYTTSGATVNAALVTGLSNPAGLGSIVGILFVTNLGNGAAGSGSIGKYTSAGVTQNAALVTGLNSPLAIAGSGDEHVYLTNFLNGTIGKYTAGGSTVNAALVTGLSSPIGIAVSGANLFVVNSGTSSIRKYTTAGATVNAALVSGLNNPWGVVVREPLQLVSAVSRKHHNGAGTLEINLPLIGEPGVECRSTGGNHSLVFKFNNNLVSGNASVTLGTASISGSPDLGTNTITVNLTGVADVQKVTVTLSTVKDNFAQVMPDTAVSVNFLSGDTTGNKTVNASDVTQTKLQSGMPVGIDNLREDVNASGVINSTDVALVKSRSGFGVP